VSLSIVSNLLDLNLINIFETSCLKFLEKSADFVNNLLKFYVTQILFSLNKTKIGFCKLANCMSPNKCNKYHSEKK
jgi:hypothetical protein